MILLPDKHTDIEVSVFVVSAKIIELLKEKGIAKYQQILDILIQEISEEVKYVFPQCLAFLFTLNRIQYHSDIDSLELL